MTKTKWADYVITQAKFKEDRMHILAVKLREDKGEEIGSSEREWKRGDVVNSIESGKTFVTVSKIGSDWKMGEDVHIVEVNNAKFIRTDKNQKEEDNLGELPEF